MAHELERNAGNEASREVAAGPEGVVPKRGGDVVGAWRNFLKSAVVALAATGVYGSAEGDDLKKPATVASAASGASEAAKKDGTETRVQRTTTKTVLIHAEDLVPEEMKITLEQWKEIEQLIRSPGSRTNSILYSKTYDHQFDLQDKIETKIWRQKRNTGQQTESAQQNGDPKRIRQKLLESERGRDALLRAKARWAGELNKELEEQGIPLRFCAGFLAQKDLQLHHPTLSPYEVPGPSSENVAAAILERYFRGGAKDKEEAKEAIRKVNDSLTVRVYAFRFYLAPDGVTPLIDWQGKKREEEARELAAKEKKSRSKTKKPSPAGAGGGAK